MSSLNQTTQSHP